MTTKEAIDHLRDVLQKDESYRIGWQANIAMAVKDHWHFNKKRDEETETEYIHRLANGAADAFLEQLAPLKKIDKDLPGMLVVKGIHSK